jgi:ankyrin repeat protein
MEQVNNRFFIVMAVLVSMSLVQDGFAAEAGSFKPNAFRATEILSPHNCLFRLSGRPISKIIAGNTLKFLIDCNLYLHLAAFLGNEEDVKRLIFEGRSISEKDEKGLTPLHYAAGRGHSRIVKYLIKFDPGSIYYRCACEATPLHYAAKGGHLEIVENLVENGADVMSRDCTGEKPLEWADKMSWVCVSNFLRDTEMQFNVTRSLVSFL